MDEIGKVTLKTISVLGHSITFNPITIIMTWLVMIIFLMLAYYGGRQLKQIPSKLQGIFEVVFEFLHEITYSTLGDKDGKKFFPFIVTLFIFILLANWIGIIPNVFKILGMFIALLHKVVGGSVEMVYQGVTNITIIPSPESWYYFLFKLPAIEEPTRSVNTDLALGILVFILVHLNGIKSKGVVRYLRDYVDDPFPMKGPLIIFFFLNPFFYLNIIGAIANIVSHSFRLFGNIFGGGMIIVIVSSLLKFFLVPVGLFAFFGLFAGLVQAFVFAMLAVTYIQQQQAE